MLILLIFNSCYKDNGNYDYLSEDEVGVIKIDTINVPDRYALMRSLNPGDTVKMQMNVTYSHKENLRYRWIAYPYPYKAVQSGNAMVYPAADTIATTKDLSWVVNLDPGNWTFKYFVEDTISGQKTFFDFGGYTVINQNGSRTALYLLTEIDGETDIELYSSKLALVWSGDKTYPRYRSQTLGCGLLPGSPEFLGYSSSSGAVYVFTDQNGYRLNKAGLTKLDEFSGMFYNVPTYNPQAFVNINSCDFLINNGKLHVLYKSMSNDGKFSAPISGDYDLFPYLIYQTKNTYSPISGAINADQIVYDTKNNQFRPYYPQSTGVANFKTTVGNAVADVNNMPGTPLAIVDCNGGSTYAIMNVAGIPYLYQLCFYNVVDDGDLSQGNVVSLAGCTDLLKAKNFCSSEAGSAFFYATDKNVYSFSTTSGKTTSNTLYTCEANEEVTYIAQMPSGGFPTAGCVLWIAVWDSAEKDGKIVEFEVDPYGGIARSQWGPMFGSTNPNPYKVGGYGKIKYMLPITSMSF